MANRHRYKNAVNKNGYKIIECLTCGYWHVYPKPSQEQLDKYYREKYFAKFAKGSKRPMTDKISDPDGYYNIQYQDRARYIEKYLPKRLPKIIIDLGAGYGDFLSFMQEKGWSTSGVELSGDTFKGSKARKLGIIHGNINESCQKLAPASVVTINNVLEHVSDPENILELAKRLLLPGGLLSIVIPNDFSDLQNVLMDTVLKKSKKQNYWVDLPEHLNYWSTRTIKTLLSRKRFETLDMISDFPLEIFALMGEDYINYPEKGKSVHLKRVSFEKHLQKAGKDNLKEQLYKSFADIGIGRNIQIIARIAKNEM